MGFRAVYRIDKILHSGSSPFQTVDIVDLAPFGRTLLIDGMIQSSQVRACGARASRGARSDRSCPLPFSRAARPPAQRARARRPDAHTGHSARAARDSAGRAEGWARAAPRGAVCSVRVSCRHGLTASVRCCGAAACARACHSCCQLPAIMVHRRRAADGVQREPARAPQRAREGAASPSRLRARQAFRARALIDAPFAASRAPRPRMAWLGWSHISKHFAPPACRERAPPSAGGPAPCRWTSSCTTRASCTRPCSSTRRASRPCTSGAGARARRHARCAPSTPAPVSYTHLTLPTTRFV